MKGLSRFFVGMLGMSILLGLLAACGGAGIGGIGNAPTGSQCTSGVTEKDFEWTPFNASHPGPGTATYTPTKGVCGATVKGLGPDVQDTPAQSIVFSSIKANPLTYRSIIGSGHGIQVTTDCVLSDGATWDDTLGFLQLPFAQQADGKCTIDVLYLANTNS